MAIDYDLNMDWEQVIRAIMPDAAYSGKQAYRNRAGFNKDIVWTDARTKPTWEDLATRWMHPTAAGSGVRHDRNSPGDYKVSAMTIDHGKWLFIPPNDGRVLERDDYPILFNVLGTSFNGLYQGITATQFGLPIPGGKTPVIAGGGKVMGQQGGSSARVLTISIGGGGGSPNTETTPYFVAGNLFIFVGELRYG